MMNLNETILDHPLFDRQIELEQEMRSAGIKRFRDNIDRASKKGTISDTQAGTRLVTASHDKMVEAINAFIQEASSGRAGRKHTAIKYLQMLDDVDVAANLTARCVLDGITKNPMLSQCAFSLGAMIEDEVNSRKFQREMPKAYDKFLGKAKQETLERRKWSHLLFPARLLGVELVEWDQKDKNLLGTKLIELFIQATGLVTMVRVAEGKDNFAYRLEANAETLAWMEEENSRLEGLFPIYMPTIIPPKPWTSPFEGGYWSRVIGALKMVKTHNKAYLNELADRHMPEVYSALNALQDTAWQINTNVLDVMMAVYQTNSEIGEIPRAEKIEPPQKPVWLPENGKMAREEMTEEQLDEFLRWKALAAETHIENAAQIKRRAQFLRTVSVANTFKDEEAIYFPHQLDWRGRAYPVPLYLNPQGNDLQRALLVFANVVPIKDEEDAGWLAIHGAGLWGVDKVSLEDRIAWVHENSDKIVASARDPFECRFWVDADKPWQALAFCFEWAEFCEVGYGFESCLPVQMDGTCNGLQNFSAMLLDEVGGAAVNLIPADKPQDIYQKVCDLVKAQVEKDLDSEAVIKAKFTDENGVEVERVLCTVAEIARGWLPKMSRKVTKRPVMTLAYGAKQFGFTKQVEDDTIKPWRMEDPAGYPFVRSGDDGKTIDYGYQAALYMGRLIWQSVGEVVIAARAAMDWLQEAARITSKEGMPVLWSTPTGFLVSQAYRVPNVKMVETTFNSTRIRLSYRAGEGKIDSRRQAAGISPNWVHSLDASHMMKTINRCNEEGITSFSMIHDSYGTHAGNAWAMAQILRDQFVQMYAEVDVLGRFKEELEHQIGEELPALPPKGNLDLELVRQSPFFFA